MPSLDEIMKMAQSAQAELQKATDNLDSVEVEGMSGGGLFAAYAGLLGARLIAAVEMPIGVQFQRPRHCRPRGTRLWD